MKAAPRGDIFASSVSIPIVSSNKEVNGYNNNNNNNNNNEDDNCDDGDDGDDDDYTNSCGCEVGTVGNI